MMFKTVVAQTEIFDEESFWSIQDEYEDDQELPTVKFPLPKPATNFQHIRKVLEEAEEKLQKSQILTKSHPDRNEIASILDTLQML
jgi:hypothetical protein